MSEIRDVEKFAEREFSNLLLQHGFCPPVITRSRTRTRIDFLKADFAIEVELDWHDYVAFVLLVRLENGKLPKGYYFFEGRRCRKHLSGVIGEQGWRTSEGPDFSQRGARPSNASDLKRVLLKYREQLNCCVDKLLDIGAAAV